MTDVGAEILVVDDDQSMCEFLEVALRKRGYHVTARTSGDQALEFLTRADVDAVVTDLNMHGLSGLELCTRLAANRPDVPVVVITAFGSLDSAIGAIRAGAYDFITKPLEVDVLAVALDRAVQHRRLRDEVRRLREEMGRAQRVEELLGSSVAMQEVRDLVLRVASTESGVLITGESGTGKEIVARALHRLGRRDDGPFVAVNGSAIPEALLESELFGYERGAFTDARVAHKGLFVQAFGGTLFLDEIGDLPVVLQPKLLRVLEERAVRPLGSCGEVPIDVRVIAATNRDLETAVAEGRFREDLYFRLNVITIELPPLRARGNDVLMLAQHFLERYAVGSERGVAGLSPGAAERLLAYTWPGNVRELRNCMERAVALTRFEELTVDDLPEKIRSYESSRVPASDDPTALVPLEEVERRYVQRVLDAVGGNKTLAARILGLDRTTLYRKLDKRAR